MYLPEGRWFNFFTQEEMTGGSEIWVEVAPDTFPLFVKAGAVIPMMAVAQSTSLMDKREMILHTYFSESRNHSEFYEDDGEGYEYLKGEFSIKRFSVFGNKKQMRILQNKFGKYLSAYNEYQMFVHGLPFKPRRIIIDGQTLKVAMRGRDKSLSFKAPSGFKRIEIH
jgi:alpha-glucosidase